VKDGDDGVTCPDSY